MHTLCFVNFAFLSKEQQQLFIPGLTHAYICTAMKVGALFCSCTAAIDMQSFSAGKDKGFVYSKPTWSHAQCLCNPNKAFDFNIVYKLIEIKCMVHVSI